RRAFAEKAPRTRRDFAEAGKAAGVGAAAARTAWQRHLAAQLAEERALRRAELSVGTLRAQREELLADAALRSATMLQAMVQRCGRAIEVLSDKFVAMATDPNATPATIVKMLDRLGLAVKRAAETGEVAVRLERLRVGDATSIVRVERAEAEPSVEELEA